MISIPTQTNEGIEATALLNPLLTIDARVMIDEKFISGTTDEDSREKRAPLASNGVYRILSLSYIGDTFGTDWYTKMVCIAVDESAPDGQKVSIS
jgi:hypothetical protein